MFLLIELSDFKTGKFLCRVVQEKTLPEETRIEIPGNDILTLKKTCIPKTKNSYGTMVVCSLFAEHIWTASMDRALEIQLSIFEVCYVLKRGLEKNLGSRMMC